MDLDLLDFLRDLSNYVVIKKDADFPRFSVGKDDVDILCYDTAQAREHIISVLNAKYKRHSHRFNSENDQLDVLLGRQFIVKFDLYNSLKTMYPRYDIPEGLTREVVDRGALDDSGCRVPLLTHELMIRQLEYDTHYEKRPDKIKHLKYIEGFPAIEYTRFNART